MWSFAETGVTLELVVLMWESFYVPKQVHAVLSDTYLEFY